MSRGPTPAAETDRSGATARTAAVTDAQRRLWLLDQMTPGNTAYHVVTALRLRGPLDTTALRWALNRVVARHDALRTTFVSRDGQPVQKVAGTLSLPLPETDAGTAAGQDPAEAAHAVVDRLLAEPFGLASGPLIRATLVRLDALDHVLCLMCHHIVCDGWSMEVLCTEVAAYYSAHRAGQPPGVAAVPAQYPDLAVSQHKEATTGRARGGTSQHPGGRGSSLDHWRDRLAGSPALLELPLSRVRPPVQGFRGASVRFGLDPARWESVRRRASEGRATPFMVLLTAYAVLLSRLCGTRDLVVGTPSAGRARAALGPVIGMFVNTLPLRLEFTGDPPFDEVVGHVRARVLEAHRHQYVPLERIVAQLAPERATSHDPLFQTMFALQPPAEAPSFEGLECAVFPVTTSAALCDLWLEIRPGRTGADCALHYRTELFEREAVERISRYYLRVLDTALDAPRTRLCDLPVLAPPERRMILDEWSRGQPAPARQEPVHRVIAAQAARTPEATAVVCGEERMSYAELSARSGCLARYLVDQRAGPGQVVALCLERGAELPVSVLGVLAAGNAFLPLSPQDPPARLARLLAASGATRVLATRTTAPALDQLGVPVVPVDELPVNGPGLTEYEAPGTGPEDLAYVIYTSGSTGEPKPVAVPHRGLANRISGIRQAQELTSADRVLHKTPYTFDVSVWELLWPLTAGAAIVMAAPGGHRDPAHLVRLIEREAVSTVHFVPPMLEAFIEQDGLDRCRSLRRVLCSGQALSAAQRDRCLSVLPWARLYNLYGPTEASIDVTEWECRSPVPGSPEQARVPIGRPLRGVESYVLDAEMRPVPPGVRGELYLGGTALARGYLGQPALTADRFVPHLYADTPGSRLYRTGDIVRWRSDGVLEYLGRNDHQLKIRGFRIEPGEVESTARTHPEILNAVVTADDMGLVGYLVPRHENSAPWIAEAVRDLLRQRLPGYMVPSRWVVLTELPLTTSGKTDLAALPAPATGEQRSGRAPGSPEETVLEVIWSAVLGRRSTGVTEDFFELGGDSLRGIELVHRAREAGLPLTVGDLFRHPTIAELALHVRGAAPSGPAGPAPGGDPPGGTRKAVQE